MWASLTFVVSRRLWGGGWVGEINLFLGKFEDRSSLCLGFIEYV